MRDVLVIGAGPAGASFAAFLVRRRPDLRDRVLVIDKARFPRDKPCAGAVAARADRLLARAGLAVDVPSVPIAGMSVALPGGRIERRPGRLGRVVRRLEFDAELVAQVRNLGVRIDEGVAVRGLEPGSDRVRVHTGAGTLEARVVVGADGAGSAVRRALGIPGGRFQGHAIEADTQTCATDEALLHFDLTDPGLRGYAWEFPTPLGGRTAGCHGVYALGRPTPSVSLRLAARAPGAGPSRGFPLRGLDPALPASRPRVLLIGEAAGVDPVFGEGIAQAIESAEVAAGVVDRALRRGGFAFRSWSARLALSPFGLGVHLREAALPLLYGPGGAWSRAFAARAPSVLELTTAAFAGRLAPPGSLPRIARDLLR